MRLDRFLVFLPSQKGRSERRFHDLDEAVRFAQSIANTEQIEVPVCDCPTERRTKVIRICSPVAVVAEPRR